MMPGSGEPISLGMDTCLRQPFNATSRIMIPSTIRSSPRMRCSGAGAVFSYLEESLEDGRLDQAARQEAFRTAVLRAMGRLIAADAAAAATLVLSHFAEDHAAVVTSLDSTPELQYEYLKVRILTYCGASGVLARFICRQNPHAEY